MGAYPVRTTTRSAAAAGRPETRPRLRSALRSSAGASPRPALVRAVHRDEDEDGGPPGLSARRAMAQEFILTLRASTNRNGVPFAEGTLTAYRDAVVALDAWMTREDITGDFTVCDAKLLNRFFADYLREHSQGGVNTKQRNLRHFFTWLATEYDHPHPYLERLNRYRRRKSNPRRWARTSGQVPWRGVRG